MAQTIEEKLVETNKQLAQALDVFLPDKKCPHAQLIAAMRYAVLGKAKRIRACLSILTGKLLDLPNESLLHIACAIECLHAASLVHDDLPALDRAEFRRGKPCVYKVYGEDMAILVGDSLITLAFEILASPKVSKIGELRASMLLLMARAFGAEGVCGGQYLDLRSKEKADLAYITRLQRMKTGALLKVAVSLPYCLAHSAPEVRHALDRYAQDLGLIYQMTDDLLDVQGDPETLGKDIGQDQKTGKENFVSLLGEETARQRIDILGKQAKMHLKLFGGAAQPLAELTDYIINRRH